MFNLKFKCNFHISHQKATLKGVGSHFPECSAPSSKWTFLMVGIFRKQSGYNPGQRCSVVSEDLLQNIYILWSFHRSFLYAYICICMSLKYLSSVFLSNKIELMEHFLYVFISVSFQKQQHIGTLGFIYWPLKDVVVSMVTAHWHHFPS